MCVCVLKLLQAWISIVGVLCQCCDRTKDSPGREEPPAADGPEPQQYRIYGSGVGPPFSIAMVQCAHVVECMEAPLSEKLKGNTVVPALAASIGFRKERTWAIAVRRGSHKSVFLPKTTGRYSQERKRQKFSSEL